MQSRSRSTVRVIGQSSLLELGLGLHARYGQRLCYYWRPLANEIKLKWSVRPWVRACLVINVIPRVILRSEANQLLFSCSSSSIGPGD